MAILHETPDVAIHHRPSGLCAIVQQHPHRSIDMAPSHVSYQNQEQVWQRLYGHDGKGVPKLRVSDRVRISKYKGKFEKGYAVNWSEEMFTIHEVHPSVPPLYRLRDNLGEVLDGTFYEMELQTVSAPVDKVYYLEAVLHRRNVGRRTEALVKRLPLQIQQLDRCQGIRPLHYKDWPRVRRHFIREMTQDTTTQDFTTTVIEQEEEQEDVVAAEDSTDSQNAEESNSTPWHLFGTVCPKEEIVLLCQVLVLFTVILISFYNLTTGHENSNLWTALLSSSLGYLLPNPTLRINDD